MLTKEELQNIIEQFDEEQLKSEGIFGIFQSGHHESYIRANKEGLELFALALLKTAGGSSQLTSGSENLLIQFDYDEDWIDENSDTFIEGIELVNEKQKAKLKSDNKVTFADKFLPYGCVIMAVILVISLIVGLVTVFKWLF